MSMEQNLLLPLGKLNNWKPSERAFWPEANWVSGKAIAIICGFPKKACDSALSTNDAFVCWLQCPSMNTITGVSSVISTPLLVLWFLSLPLSVSPCSLWCWVDYEHFSPFSTYCNQRVLFLDHNYLVTLKHLGIRK